jgi:signal peptidase I
MSKLTAARSRLTATESEFLMNEATSRSPLVAVVLSLFATGLGHVYCGRIVPGLVLFLMSLLAAPVAVAAAFLGLSMPVMICLGVAILAVVAAYLFSVIDSFRVARRLRTGFEPREYNRAAVYVPILLVALTYPPLAVAQLRAHVLEAFYIPSAGMTPSVLQGDRLLVNKLAYRRRPVERGELIVFRSPKDRRLTWIKRVIGLPGDTIELNNNEVFVNGKQLHRDRVPASSLSALPKQGDVYEETNGGRRYKVLLAPTPGEHADLAKTTTPEGTVFVLGDSRDNSADSRDPAIGFVPLGDILGAVEFIYYPAESWQRFGPYRD